MKRRKLIAATIGKGQEYSEKNGRAASFSEAYPGAIPASIKQFCTNITHAPPHKDSAAHA
jgi:hypothetical protein